MLAQRASLRSSAGLVLARAASNGRVKAANPAHTTCGWRRQHNQSCVSGRRVSVCSTEENKEEKSKAVASTVGDNDDDPIWVRREKMREVQKESGTDLPFFVYLLAAGVVAIAAVGSVFEYFERNAVFGVIQPESPFWLPILAFFSLTGLPVSGLLFFKAVESANKAAEQMDEVDRL